MVSRNYDDLDWYSTLNATALRYDLRYEDAVAKIIDEKNVYFGLDVLSVEPMLENHPLLSVKNKENLYITPHIAWTSVEAREKLIATVIKNIKSLN